MAADGAPQRKLEFFTKITDSFKLSAASSDTADYKDMKVGPFLDAMTMFLRIFDAFDNKIFTETVKGDVKGNIDKLRAAAAKTGGATLDAVIETELSDPAFAKLIKDEKGKGQNAGTVALLWMKRTMQFIIGLLKQLVDDKAVSLVSASRSSYSKSLGFCHNFVTRGLFSTGLGFAPSRKTFYHNLSGGEPDSEVDAAMTDFLTVFQPQLDGLVALYKTRGLEKNIK